MKIGYDATDPASIPWEVVPPDYAMGYVDGQWPSYAAMRLRFPKPVPVAITAVPGSPEAAQAQMADGEKGDYNPTMAARWAMARQMDGFVPAIYCSYSNWPAYQQAVIDLGLSGIDWMIAAYPGIGPVLYAGSPGHQWIDRGTYDEWVIHDGWIPGRPISAPTQPVRNEAQMLARNTKGKGYWAVRPSGNVYAYSGAPYLGPAPRFLTEWGIGTAQNPVVGIADDGNGGFVLEADSGASPGQPALYHIDSSGQFRT